MATKKRKTMKDKAKTLAARPLSGKQSDGVKGGDTSCAGSTYKSVTLGLRKSGGSAN